MKVGIIGCGVVGGATAQVLGSVHRIYLYDKYKKLLNRRGLLNRLAKEAEVVFICVPTPMQPSGAIDYSAIHNSIESLLVAAKKGKRQPRDILVVIRSTAVSGTTDELAKKYPFRFAFNPEFLTEKNAVSDMEQTDRVVIGANDKKSLNQLEDLYRAVFPEARQICVNRKTAEMIKYAANVMLAIQIAGANELYRICQAVGVGYEIVKNVILLDPRIGRNISVPGPDNDFGFGGKCLPKDLNALIHLARSKEYRPYLLEEVWRLNEQVRQNQDWREIPGATTKLPHR